MRVYLTNSQSTASNVSTFIYIEYLHKVRYPEDSQREDKVKPHTANICTILDTRLSLQGERIRARGCICTCSIESTIPCFHYYTSYYRDYVVTGNYSSLSTV